MSNAAVARLGVDQVWRRNREQLVRDMQAGRTQLSGKPVHLKLELTNYCNLSCPMCPHQSMQRPVGYMSPTLFRRIIDQAVPELEFAYVHHLGESLFQKNDRVASRTYFAQLVKEIPSSKYYQQSLNLAQDLGDRQVIANILLAPLSCAAMAPMTP